VKREIYSCDICGDEKNPVDLLGLKFSGMQDFKVTNARATDGKHLCLRCARQIKDQLPAALLSDYT
jgi:hypothetical protein